jgi:hypothetical protein
VADTPLRPEDMNKFAGQFVKAESSMFDLLPKGATIAVAGAGRHKPTSYDAICFLCGAAVLMDSDLLAKAIAAGEKVVCILCPECYFRMEPKEVARG